MTSTACLVTATAILWWASTSHVPAHALLSARVTASVAYSSGTLQPPASVNATCSAVGSNSTATVNWTASPSGYATGYRVVSAPVSQTLNVASTARTATLTGLTKGGSYTFSVLTTYRNWTSTARTTTTVTC